MVFDHQCCDYQLLWTVFQAMHVVEYSDLSLKSCEIIRIELSSSPHIRPAPII